MDSYNRINIFKKIKSLFKYVFDKNVSFFKKIIIILVFIYILSPFDIIPDPILGFGILDDITLLLITYTFYKGELKKYEDEKVNSKDKEDIIDNVDYTIKNKEEL